MRLYPSINSRSARAQERRQYGLADRAKQLGWTTVEIIDDDLGRSGGGIARPGFERLLAAICDGRVGAVLAIEASRLARNGREVGQMRTFLERFGESQPRRAASIAVTSIFFMPIIASNARFASSPPAASASVKARGVICQDTPHLSLHHPHALSCPPFPTIAFQ